MARTIYATLDPHTGEVVCSECYRAFARTGLFSGDAHCGPGVHRHVALPVGYVRDDVPGIWQPSARARARGTVGRSVTRRTPKALDDGVPITGVWLDELPAIARCHWCQARNTLDPARLGADVRPWPRGPYPQQPDTDERLARTPHRNRQPERGGLVREAPDDTDLA